MTEFFSSSQCWGRSQTFYRKLGLSPTYTSKIFKIATGYNFVEYLSMARVNKAKSLLSDLNSKVYEVSSLVGYKSTKHFSQVFRSYTGMTPTDYRESINVAKDVK